MANYVKISLLSQPALSHSPYSDDLEGKVQEMLAYLNENLQKVLPDKPDLIVVPEACDRFPSFTMEERKRSERYVLLASVTLSTLFGGVLMNMIEVHLSEVLTLTMVSIATGMILYIVFSELTPHVFRTREHLRESLTSVVIGFALVWVSTLVA